MQMPHVEINITQNEAKKLLIKKKCFLIRWEDSFDSLPGSHWWHIIKDKVEDLDALSRNTRSKIRRGKKYLQAFPCSRDLIIKNGYDVYSAAFKRYSTFEQRYSKHDFKNAVFNFPKDAAFWGVFENKTERLVAFSENIVRDDACFYSTIWFEPESLRKYASYVLIHEMNKYYLNSMGLKYVTDGSKSISHKTNIQNYLINSFFFRKAYSNLRVVYFPGMYIIICCLYPFRHYLKSHPSSHLQKLSVLLEQERIRRLCAKNWS